MTILTPVVGMTPLLADPVADLLHDVERSAHSLIDALERKIESGLPFEAAMNWLGRSQDARRGLLLQRAVVTAIVCHGRYEVCEGAALPLPAPRGRQKVIKVDCLLYDKESSCVSAWEITRTTNTRSPVVWADRIRLIRDLLHHHAPSLPGRPAAEPVTLLSADSHPLLPQDLGAQVLTLKDLARVMDIPAEWAVKAALKRFDVLVAQGLADAGL